MYKIGDVLSVQYTGFKHYGLYVGDNKVIHNSKSSKFVLEVSLSEFADGKNVNVSSIQANNTAIAVQTARKYLGLPYSLFSENCEHFVRTCCGLVKESTQVQKYLISALGTGILLKSDNTVIQAAGGAAAIGAMLTPSESSPVKNAAILACLVAGIAFLATHSE
ncbi:lecithin retinol acyltransferase family protein [Pseudoalteromonas sp. SCSIO 43201]|uniref:lecithin retinol acyltransferase family protein n=1 Tax=Pseudoalteromonas sp. SCSIO 43201 TaxID=2822842 RepID=UPI00207571FD|nr:lecithin retinol acyltransferase family protein [Pseudoalteromonas sp. SCSIO 43201]USD30224.1 lecithin retinol acyltransferase family protein [Pseudoalteromonas sp. SCSIO 43201]